MNKKKQIQLNITQNNKLEQETLNTNYANYFESFIVQQFRDNCHMLEAKRLLNSNQSITEMKTIINNETVHNSNVRMRLWQNFEETYE